MRAYKPKKKIAFEHFPTKIKQSTISYFAQREREMWLFNRKGASGFSASSTAEEVTEGIDGTGLTAIVTGGSSGIGTETARVLALRGVHVVMGVRNMTAGREVKEAMVKGNPTAKIDAMELDLSSIASVRKFAEEFNSSGLPLSILMSHGNTIHAFQRQHRTTICNKPPRYNGLSAYGQSKLANILHANELSRRLKENGAEITANSVHPGAVATDLFRHHSFVSGLIGLLGKYMIKNVQQGAATTCYVALHPQVKGVSGHYFSDSNKVEASPQANDSELAKKLWNFSLNMIDGCTPVS
ncbi:short-chain dehydrogenase TIC 32, chloroplastic-like isoform X2 [Castanea sativa]|uniref:short-chain dehydrogenase TIC 32, chloroplastic-like isoform X2 n=1 Tax=Castanea sativa TaxID=21020 RepID=UPI003F652511